jgi:hypothetical protein
MYSIDYSNVPTHNRHTQRIVTPYTECVLMYVAQIETQDQDHNSYLPTTNSEYYQEDELQGVMLLTVYCVSLTVSLLVLATHPTDELQSRTNLANFLCK